MNFCDKKQWIRFAITSYACIMLAATEEVWTGIINDKIGGFINSIFKALEIPIVNAATTLSIILIAFYSLYKIFGKKEFQLSVFPIITCSAWLLINGKTWNAVPSCLWGLPYNKLFFFICVLLAVFIIISVVSQCGSEEDGKEYSQGFAVDTEQQKLVNVGWEGCYQALYEKLIETDLRKECFTIGITGEWGSGKTTFLTGLRTMIATRFKIIEFNPWICKDTEQIANNFFKTFTNAIHNNSEVVNSLRKYADALENIEYFRWMSYFFGKSSQSSKPSLQELKKFADNHVAYHQKPFAVLIDDIDRLDSKEVMEVLRLIRITANFPNIVFIVAYDPRHVIQMLAENGIKNGNEYLKKMFQLEFALPSYEGYKIPEILFHEFKRFIENRDTLKALYNQIIIKDDIIKEYILPNYLKNFRDVKRFANAFSLSLHQITKIGSGDFEICDLFWIELLHYSDPDAYHDLYNVRMKYLNAVKVSGLIRYKLKEDKEISQMVNPYSHTILKHLFSGSSASNNQLCFEANFLNYFCFRLPEHAISSQELLSLITTDLTEDTLESKLNEWFDGKPAQKMSLLKRLAKLHVPNLSLSSQRRVIFTLVWAGMKYKVEDVRSILIRQLSEGNYVEQDRNTLRNYLLKRIIDSLPNAQNLNNWAQILCGLYPVLIYNNDEDGCHDRFEPRTLLTADDIVQQTCLCLNEFLNRMGNIPPITELMFDNPLHQFLQVCTTDVSVEEENPEIRHKKCLAFDTLVDIYSKEKSTEFKQFTRLLYSYDYSVCDPDMLEEYYSKSLYDIFGNKEDYKKFVQTCFNITEEEINEHFIELGFLQRPKQHKPLTTIVSNTSLSPEINY